jgi:hypothetical protein
MEGAVTIILDEELRHTLNRISFRNSVLDLGWRFCFEPLPVALGHKRCWRIWAEFRRPDTHTGVMGIGRGRDEIVWAGATADGVIKTCWLLVELLVRHELMEGFRVDGLRVFDPHATIEDLQLSQTIGTRKGVQ